MATPKARYIITSKDESRQGLQSAENNVSQMAQKAVRSFTAIAAGVAATIAAVKGLTGAVSGALDAYAQQETAELRLSAAARNNPLIDGTAVEGLKDYAAELQAATTFGDEAIIQQQSFLVALGLSEEQIRNTLDAAVNLASTGMMTLDSAVRNISKSYGGLAGELGEMIPAMRDLTTEELQAGAAAELISQQFGGMAEAVANSSAGIKQQFQNMWGDFAENVGSALAPLQTTVLQKLKPVLDGISKWFSDNATKITNFFLHLPEILAIVFTAVAEGFKKAFTLEHIVENFKAAFEWIKTAWEHLIPFLWSTFKRYIETVYNVWVRVFQSIWEVVKRVGETIWTPIQYGLEWAVYGIKVGWRAMIQFFARMIDWLINNPINKIGEAFHNVVQSIKRVFEVVVNALIDGLNAVLRPIDQIMFAIRQIGEHGMRFRQWDEYVEGAGGTNLQFEKITVDTTPWEDLSSDIAGRIGEEVEPPEVRDIGQEIRDIWEDTGEAITEPWRDFGTTLGDIWNGFGGEFKETFSTMSDATQDLLGQVYGPWVDSFAEAGDRIREILGQDLPLELQQAAADIVEETARVAETIATNTGQGAGGPNPNMGGYMTGGGGPPTMMWDIFWGYMGNLWKNFSNRFKTNAVNLWNNIKDFGGRIRDGIQTIGDAIRNPSRTLERIIHNFKEGFAEAGFGVVRTIRAIGQSLAQNTGNIAGAVGEGAMDILKWLLQKLWELIQSTEQFRNMLDYVMVSLQNILGGVIEPLAEALSPIIEIIILIVQQVAQFLVPIFQMLGQLIQSLMPVFVSLGNVLLALANLVLTMAPILMVFAQIMGTVLSPILEALAPILLGLGSIIEAVLPIIGFFAKIIDAASRPIEFLADMVKYVADWFGYVARALGDFVYNIAHPLNQRNTAGSAPRFSSDAFTRALIDMGDYAQFNPGNLGTEINTDELTGISTEDLTGEVTGGAAAANYQQQRPINNYFTFTNSYFVGTLGWDEFVTMVDTRIKELNALA